MFKDTVKEKWYDLNPPLLDAMFGSVPKCFADVKNGHKLCGCCKGHLDESLSHGPAVLHWSLLRLTVLTAMSKFLPAVQVSNCTQPKNVYLWLRTWHLCMDRKRVRSMIWSLDV
ncbi:hypothetical protein EG68_00534 [Paragonimus skrjabini miyazakii]|uniref:Uncharacterized protein n=1 Tax=Paragonimus skrjabini miyazakii TaxID=59628 RepID=A0A8S9ZCB7_9TREM|nr:hypothetical protein EG68_00534 [Paragonimus skrjabini miyazakii]